MTESEPPKCDLTLTCVCARSGPAPAAAPTCELRSQQAATHCHHEKTPARMHTHRTHRCTQLHTGTSKYGPPGWAQHTHKHTSTCSVTEAPSVLAPAAAAPSAPKHSRLSLSKSIPQIKPHQQTGRIDVYCIQQTHTQRGTLSCCGCIAMVHSDRRRHKSTHLSQCLQ